MNPPDVITSDFPVVSAPAYRSAPGNWIATVAPTVTDDNTLGYNYTSHWYKVVWPFQLWVCVDPSTAAAVWKEIPIADVTGYVIANASESIAQGDMVNFHNVAGVLKVRKANATDATKPCDGYLYRISATSGQDVPIRIARGCRDVDASGLTIADRLYLSTTGGGVTATPPSTSGNIVQPIGKALSATSMLFDPQGWTVVP